MNEGEENDKTGQCHLSYEASFSLECCHHVSEGGGDPPAAATTTNSHSA